jgi:excisionase family DNA binding protein
VASLEQEATLLHVDTEAQIYKTPVALLTVKQFSHAASVCRSHVYALIRDRKIKSILLGRSRRIPASELQRLAANAR